MISFLPSSKKTHNLIIRYLNESNFSKELPVYDLGSGDGRVVRTLNDSGYRAYGVEKKLKKVAGVESLIFICGRSNFV